MNGRTAFKAACALAGAGSMALGGAAWAQADAARSVSSDGSALQAPAALSGGSSASYAGADRADTAPDARAEYPAFALSPEMRADWQRRFQPKVAPRAGGERALPESVIGPDRRFRVYPRESGFPYRAIGLLTFTQAGLEFFCTGFLISKDTVATAGHCVHEGSGGAWSRDVKFYPAFNNGNAPFGSCGARKLFAVAKWTENHDLDDAEMYDYGAVKLSCEIGQTTGWFGYYATPELDAKLSVLVMGYPGDKARGTFWGGSGELVTEELRKLRYLIDTGGGESGSPVIEADRGASKARCFGTCVVGIHAYGNDRGTNSGTRITGMVAANLTVWKNAP